MSEQRSRLRAGLGAGVVHHQNGLDISGDRLVEVLSLGGEGNVVPGVQFHRRVHRTGPQDAGLHGNVFDAGVAVGGLDLSFTRGEVINLGHAGTAGESREQPQIHRIAGFRLAELL